MFLTPQILINLLLDTLILIFLSIAFVIALRVVLYFNLEEDTPLQYSLQKEQYLASVIISFALFFKILLFFYFIYTLDMLSNIIPGAMCAAGVVTANEYGVFLLLVKLVNIYLFSFWLLLNFYDGSTKDYRYTKTKFTFFIFIFIFVVIEYILEILYFRGLDVNKIVSCCGVLFSPLKSSSLFAFFLKIPPHLGVAALYLLYIVILLSKKWVLRIAGALFLVTALIAIIQFFSPYIYELPTHHCPFCMLQKEYGYIGYFIYATLFLGTFAAMAGYKRWAVWLLGITLLILSYFVIGFYIKNGVWLF